MVVPGEYLGVNYNFFFFSQKNYQKKEEEESLPLYCSVVSLHIKLSFMNISDFNQLLNLECCDSRY